MIPTQVPDTNMYSLYLDDERSPKTQREWVVVRSYLEAVELMIAYGCPTYMSFDHDLGTEQTGLSVAQWMVERDLDCPNWIPVIFEFNVHSANPVGAKHIQHYLDHYMKFRDVKKTR